MVTYERVVSHRCKIKNVQVPLALLYFTFCLTLPTVVDILSNLQV